MFEIRASVLSLRLSLIDGEVKQTMENCRVASVPAVAAGLAAGGSQ